MYTHYNVFVILLVLFYSPDTIFRLENYHFQQFVLNNHSVRNTIAFCYKQDITVAVLLPFMRFHQQYSTCISLKKKFKSVSIMSGEKKKQYPRDSRLMRLLTCRNNFCGGDIIIFPYFAVVILCTYVGVLYKQ